MDKKQFVEMVSNPGQFTPQDRGWLKAMLSRHPYSSVVGTLSLLADHAYGFDSDEERRAVALSLCNPSILGEMFAAATPIAPQAPAAPEKKTAEPTYDILNEINTYQEVSFKTAPKSVILSKFLQETPSRGVENSTERVQSHNFNDKKSLAPDLFSGTETLAVILEKQGRYDRALAIYKNLLANNPEKSSIFAPRIKKLETLINSK